MNSISKILSATDIGVNGTHQAGSLIPKDKNILSFFPLLDATMLNPRAIVGVYDPAIDEHFSFNFIYYNGRRLGLPGKDEYRLTGMTRYLRIKSARPGDELRLTKVGRTIRISVVPCPDGNSVPAEPMRTSVIRVTGKWKTANY